MEMTRVTGVEDPAEGTAASRGLGAEDPARLGAAVGALCTTTIDKLTGPDDPADAWHVAGLEMLG